MAGCCLSRCSWGRCLRSGLPVVAAKKTKITAKPNSIPMTNASRRDWTVSSQDSEAGPYKEKRQDPCHRHTPIWSTGDRGPLCEGHSADRHKGGGSFCVGATVTLALVNTKDTPRLFCSSDRRFLLGVCTSWQAEQIRNAGRTILNTFASISWKCQGTCRRNSMQPHYFIEVI